MLRRKLQNCRDMNDVIGGVLQVLLESFSKAAAQLEHEEEEAREEAHHLAHTAEEMRRRACLS